MICTRIGRKNTIDTDYFMKFNAVDSARKPVGTVARDFSEKEKGEDTFIQWNKKGGDEVGNNS